MTSQFKRMQFLAGIITENVLYEEEEPDFSGLSGLDDIVGDELEKAAKEEGAISEILGLTTAAFVLAIPGIINGVFRIIQAIKDKAPARFNLKKEGDPTTIDYIIKFTDKDFQKDFHGLTHTDILSTVGPAVKQDEAEKMSTSLPHCFPSPTIGVPSPCIFTG